VRHVDRDTAGNPSGDHIAFRTSRRALLGGAGVTMLAAVGAVAQPASARAVEGEVFVYPPHGTRTASPGTEISFRGITEEGLGVVEVLGSLSGGHSGLMMPHSDGEGTSFVPDAPFLAGERVTVRAGVPLRTSPSGSVTFTVATPGIPVRKESRREVDQPETPPQEFRSRPDLLPPAMTITTPANGTAPGHIFVAAKVTDGRNGAMILDDRGDLIWFAPLDSDIAEHNDFRVQQYRGEPVLTMWEGVSQVGTGFGHLVVRDSRYDVIARLQIGNGYYGADLHECLLTPNGTALVIVYHPVHWNLLTGGGATAGTALDGIVQEIDIETGRVVFEWHSLDHIGLNESAGEPPDDPAVPWDYLHLNSVEEDDDGNLILSGRHTHAIYKIERATGRVLWRLHGERSDFAMEDDGLFFYQHDARMQANGELTLFDNAESDQDKEGEVASRGLVFALDEVAKTATVVREYIHPTGILAISQGNMQVLPNGNVFIGWGSAPVFSEFDPAGNLIFNGRFPQGANSYRAYRFPWVGTPSAPPDVAVETGLGHDLTVWASWNGATEVMSWRVVAGPAADALEPVGEAARAGFETTIRVSTAEPYLAVQAIDADGTVLGTSEPIMPRG